MRSRKLSPETFFRIAAIVMLSSSAVRLAEASLSLEQAAEIALRENPAIHVAQAGLDLAAAQAREASAGRLPQIQGRQTLVHGNNPVFVFGSRLEQGRFGEADFALEALNDPDALTNLRSELGVQWTVFDQLQTGPRIAQAKAGREMAGYQKELAEQRIRLEVIRSYYGVLVAEGQKKAADEAVRTAEADVGLTGNFVKSGLRVRSDLLAAEVQLAELRQQQIQAEGEIASSRAALNTALGVDVGTEQELSGELGEEALEIPSEEELLRLALLHRPELASASAAQEAAHEGLKAARGRYLPRLDVHASYGRSGPDFTAGSADGTAGASLTLPLFEPGRRPGIDQARARESMARAQTEVLRGQIRLEVVRAYRQLVSARDRLTVSARAVEQAAEALRIVQERYGTGLVTITEVLRAQSALLGARMGNLEARYAMHVGLAGVQLATGRLTDVSAFTSLERERP